MPRVGLEPPSSDIILDHILRKPIQFYDEQFGEGFSVWAERHPMKPIQGESQWYDLCCMLAESKHNAHNGYYSHGFTFGNEVSKEKIVSGSL